MKNESKLLKWLKRTAFVIGAGALCISNVGIRSQAASQTASLQEDYTATLAGGDTINDCVSNDSKEKIYTLDFDTDGRLSLSTEVYGSNFRISLYDSDGDELKYYYCDYNESLGFGKNYYYIDLYAQTYYLKVEYRGYIDDGEFYDYTVIWNYTSANTNEIEPNDYYSQAQNLGKEAVIRGQLAINDAQDIYSINLSKKTTITLSMKSEMEGCKIHIYNSDGDEEWQKSLWQKDTGYISEEYKLNVNSGFYYIYVERINSNNSYTGPYTLTYSSK